MMARSQRGQANCPGPSEQMTADGAKESGESVDTLQLHFLAVV